MLLLSVVGSFCLQDTKKKQDLRRFFAEGALYSWRAEAVIGRYNDGEGHMWFL
jgi:hypothetical protein